MSTTDDTAAGPTGGPSGLAAELRVAVMKVGRRLRAEKSDADVSDAQYSVLALLDRAGPLTLRDLSELERVRPPSMTKTVTALLELGLVSRAGDPEDGRRVLVDLTDAGRAAVRETRRRRDVWLHRRLGDLSPRDRAVLAEAAVILRRIADT